MKRNKLEEIAKILAEKDEEETVPKSGLLDKINQIDENLKKLERILGSPEIEVKNDEPKLSDEEELKKAIADLRK